MGRRLGVAVVLVVAMSALLPGIAAATTGDQSCPAFGAKSTTATVDAAAITEASGLAASRSQPGVIWVHNDSGGANEIYAMDHDGDILMTVVLGTIKAKDWEDIAIGPGPKSGVDYIYVGDIGNNKSKRDTVQIYRIKEPVVTSGTKKIKDAKIARFDVQYENPAGGVWNRNAESLAVDPLTKQIVVFEKHHSTISGVADASWVYRIKKSQLVEGTTITAEPVTFARTRYERPIGPAAGADFTPDGRVLVVKNGYEVFAWERGEGSMFEAIAANPETECLYIGATGEAVTVAPDSSALYFLREGTNVPLERTEFEVDALECFGVPVTIEGTSGPDVLVGTAGPDVIHGKGGDDQILGMQGDDIICGGAGADEINGGAGNDVIYAGGGVDDARGGSGDDFIFGGNGADIVVGEDGADTVLGESGPDDVRGGPGYDQLDGGGGADTCDPGPDGASTTSC